MTDPSILPSTIMQTIGAVYAIFIAIMVFRHGENELSKPGLLFLFKIVSLTVLVTLCYNGFVLYLLNTETTFFHHVFFQHPSFAWSKWSYYTSLMSLFAIILYSIKIVEFSDRIGIKDRVEKIESEDNVDVTWEIYMKMMKNKI